MKTKAEAFFRAVLAQDPTALEPFFAPDACVRWHNTNEQFTAAEYITANCAYPNQWDGALERVECIGDLVIAAGAVWTLDKTSRFHVVSFLRFSGGRITALDEYWGDDGEPPVWRQEMGLGKRF